MIISSVKNKAIKSIKDLREKKTCLSEGLFVIEGDHQVREAIKYNLLVSLYVLEGSEVNYDFNYDILTLNVMKSITNMKSIPRVIGIAKIKEINKNFNKLVLLDDIQDPGNAGTIIRNAVAFGVDTVVFSKNSVSPYNEKVIRSTEGMIFNINIIIDDLNNIIEEIKNKNIPLIGTSLRTNKYINDMPKYDRYALVLGNEGAGVKEEILNKCDEIYKINMNNACESLNVSVACGIILSNLY